MAKKRLQKKREAAKQSKSAKIATAAPKAEPIKK